MAATEDQRVTFRMDPEKIDELDELILQLKARGELDRDITRSEILRESVEKKIEEFRDDLDEVKRQPAD